jgi:peroxiredoxin Q/BCP
MLRPGMRAPTRTLTDINGNDVVLGSDGRWTLLSFLRYASCSSCLLHVRELVTKQRDLSAAGIDAVVVFHSPAARIRRHTARFNGAFRLVSDPDRTLYRMFDVRASWPLLLSSFMRPAFVPAYASALRHGYWGGMVDGEFARMPADFVIDERGDIRAARYGRHIGDHMRVADVIAVAGQRMPAGGVR